MVERTGRKVSVTPSRRVDDSEVGAPASIEHELPDPPLETKGFENRTPVPTGKAHLVAATFGIIEPERLERVVLWMARLGGPALSIAAGLWVSGCTTVSPTQPRRTLPKPPSAPMSQLDHPDDWLGHGKKRTIAEAGCFITALAMASEAMTQADWDPVSANRVVKDAGGFSGPALDFADAIRALGLRSSWRGRLTPFSLVKRHAALDAHLESKRVAVASVDLAKGASSGESEGDHFIMIYAKAGDAYFAVDPLGGHVVKLVPGDDGFLRYGRDDSRRVCELCLLHPR